MSLSSKIRHLFGGKSRLGLALGSGGARGLAHIGVLRTLDAEGLPLHCIAGASAGALIGGLYSAGTSPAALEELAARLSIPEIAKLLLPSFNRGGFIDGRRVKKLIEPYTDNKVIEKLLPRFACVAADLYSGERVVFKRGNLLESIRASIAIPGIFTPAFYDDRVLVDGGVVDPLPIGLAFEMGADFVVAVRVGRQPVRDRARPEAMFSTHREESAERLTDPDPDETEEEASINWIRNSLRHLVTSYERAKEERRIQPTLIEVILATIALYEQRLSECSIRQARNCIVVQPVLEGIEILDFHKGRQAIEGGAEAMRSRIAEIRRLLRRR